MYQKIIVLAGICMLASGRSAWTETGADKTGTATTCAERAVLKRGGSASAQQFKTFCVYTDADSRDNHFVPCGIMGDVGDIHVKIACHEQPHAGKSCVQIEYNARGSRDMNWAGVFWQYPANNWGKTAKGFDLRGATKLTFWARGEKGGEQITEFKVGGITGGDFADTDCASTGPVVLTKDWKQYTIDLKERDLSNIIGGFCWVASKESNPDGFVIYLDDIRFE